MSDDEGTPIWYTVWVIFWVGVMIVGIVAVIYFDLPGRFVRSLTTAQDKEIVVSTNYSNYTGTLTTLTYQYGYWGSVDSTKAVFLDGATYTFGSQLIAQIGSNYTVTLKEITFKDNHTETNPIALNGVQ
jgi:hypothetical protein